MSELHLYGPGLLLCFTVLLFGLISPGPSVLLILNTGLRHGRAATLFTAAGVATGTTTLALLTVTGLSALIVLNARLLWWIKLCGGAYLLWLAFQSLRTAWQPTTPTTSPAPQASPQGHWCFMQGLMLHLSNPKALFVWFAIAAIGVQPDAPLWVSGVLVAGAGVLSCTINGLYALIFTTAWVYARYLSMRRLIQSVLGSAFGFAGLKLLLERT